MDSAYSIAAAVILVIVTTLYFLAKRMKNQQNLQAIEEQIRQEKELVERLNRLRDQPFIQPRADPGQINNAENYLHIEQPEPIVVPAIRKVDDSRLKRVSISTNFLLFTGASFEVDKGVQQMLYSFKSKYRIFLVTKVDSEEGEQYKAAQACIAELINDGVVQPHRVMYCTTDKGKEAMIRQLSAELHIETSIDLVRHLHQFLSKFHLIHVNEQESGPLDEAEQFAKTNSSKVLLFKSPQAYVSKLVGNKPTAQSKPVEEEAPAQTNFVQPAVKMQP